MRFAEKNKHWGVPLYDRLGFLIPGITLFVFFLTATLAILISRETALTQTHDTLTNNIHDRITFIQGAAEEFLEMGRHERLQQLISSLASDSDLVSIHIVDESNQVLASSQLADVGVVWKTLQQQFQQPLIDSVRRNQHLASYHDVEHNFLDTYASLCGGNRPDRFRLNTCGFISYRVDIKPHLQASTLALRDKSTLYILGMAVVVLFSLVLIHTLITRRTVRISAVLRQFRNGDRSVRIHDQRNDEISDLSCSINTLLDQIEKDEKEIRDGHERLHALFDTVVDSVIVINEKGIIENANPATERIFGYTPDEMIGQNISMLMPEPLRNQHDDYLANYRKNSVKNMIGTGRQVEAMHKSGNCFPAELAISEMYVQGQRLFTGVLHDISEQVEMELKMTQAYEELSAAHTRLEQRARTDKLTGLFNRGHFDATLSTEILRATRHRVPLSLIMLDIDYFKRFNDHYGHLEGDRCLKKIAQTLQNTFMRGGEVVARYGGEEFVVVLPHCDNTEAVNRAYALLNSVWNAALPHEKSDVADRVTVSIGVVTHGHEVKLPVTPEDLIKAADEMLYEAKAAGRNQVYHTLFSQHAEGAAAPDAPTVASCKPAEK